MISMHLSHACLYRNYALISRNKTFANTLMKRKKTWNHDLPDDFTFQKVTLKTLGKCTKIQKMLM